MEIEERMQLSDDNEAVRCVDFEAASLMARMLEVAAAEVPSLVCFFSLLFCFSVCLFFCVFFSFCVVLSFALAFCLFLCFSPSVCQLVGLSLG